MTKRWVVPRMWEGETVAILGNGSNMNQAVADGARMYKTIAANRAVRFAPWADMFVAIDPEHHVGLDFAGLRICGIETDDVDALYVGHCYEKVTLKPGSVIEFRNNLLTAIRIAAQAGAKKIILFGCDTDRYEQIHSFPGLTAALGALIFELSKQGIEVVGATGAALLLHAMTGLGDNLQCRAVVAELAKRYEVCVNTLWPQAYHGMPGVHINEPAPAGAIEMTAGYHAGAVKSCGSVLGAMSEAAGVPVGDFRLPVPKEWAAKARATLKEWRPRKPLLIYRPLIARGDMERDNVSAKLARNPDADAYHALISAIRERYFVVSVADCKPGSEWIVSAPIDADVECHAGELDFETLAALFSLASLVFCHPGFAAVLAQAVSAPSICVFGGYEDARSFSAGATYAPWLPIEPKSPCACWSQSCAHPKEIDIPLAIERIEEFIARNP